MLFLLCIIFVDIILILSFILPPINFRILNIYVVLRNVKSRAFALPVFPSQIFALQLDLTEDGQNHKEDVVALVFRYLPRPQCERS